MVISNFFLQDKYYQDQFFEEIFLIADTNMQVVLDMFFLFLSNIDIRFVEKKGKQRKYITTKALPINKRIELVNHKEFAAIALNLKEETYVIQVALLKIKNIVHPSRRTQIALLIIDKVPVEVPKKYVKQAHIFSKEVVTKLLENTKINDHLIDLKDDKQPLYKLIYSLKLVQLERLKTFIQDNSKNCFIR